MRLPAHARRPNVAHRSAPPVTALAVVTIALAGALTSASWPAANDTPVRIGAASATSPPQAPPQPPTSSSWSVSVEARVGVVAAPQTPPTQSPPQPPTTPSQAPPGDETPDPPAKPRDGEEQAVPAEGDAPAAEGKEQAKPAAPVFPFAIAWTVELGGAPAAPPVAWSDTIVVPLRTGLVRALASDTGEARWTLDIRTAHAVARDGVRLFAATEETLEAYDAGTGERVWRVPLPARPATAPAARRARALVALENGDLLAFEADGRLAWRQALGTAAALPPFVAGTGVHVGLTDGRVVAFDEATGAPRWTQVVGDAVSGMSMAGSRLMVGSLDNYLYCIELDDGDVDWRWRTGGDVVGRSESDDERVYFASLDNVLRALDRGHGAQRWKRALPTRPLGGPIAIGDVLVVPGVAPFLLAFERTTGKPAGRLPLEAELAFPAIAGEETPPGAEWLALVTRDGRLHKLARPAKPAETTAAER